MTRRCAEKGCPTILSIYNDEPKCHIHALPRFRGVARDGRQRRKDELEGKHPEVLDHVDQPMTEREWDVYRRHWAQREPRDVMEA